MGFVPVHLGLLKSTTLGSHPGFAFQLPPLADPVLSLEDRQLADRRAYRDHLYVRYLADDLEIQVAL